MAAAKSDEIKAQVLAALLSGQAIKETARSFHLDPATVRRYRDQAGISDATRLQPDTRLEIEAKLLAVVSDILSAISKTAALVENSAWIKKQSASDMAEFIGTLSDRAFHILGAFEDAGSDTRTD